MGKKVTMNGFFRSDQPPTLLQFHNSCLVWSSHVPPTSHISLCHSTERRFFNYKLISLILSPHRTYCITKTPDPNKSQKQLLFFKAILPVTIIQKNRKSYQVSLKQK